jgi:hypothetical protein
VRIAVLTRQSSETQFVLAHAALPFLATLTACSVHLDLTVFGFYTNVLHLLLQHPTPAFPSELIQRQANPTPQKEINEMSWCVMA